MVTLLCRDYSQELQPAQCQHVCGYDWFVPAVPYL